MGHISLNEWVAEAGFQREDCFKHGYRELYLDIGFFNAQFASVDFVLTSLLAVATSPRDPQAVAPFASAMDAKEKIRRFRKACRIPGNIGPNLDARLRVFEKQSIGLKNKIAHSTILPADDWPESYEFFTMLEQLSGMPNWLRQTEPSENIRADRIWKHGIWLHNFLTDLGTVELTWAMTDKFEIPSPRTPVLEAGRL